MSELVPVLIPAEIDQLRWANLKLQCDLLRQQAETLNIQANQVAAVANGLSGEVIKALANGTAEKYEPRIVEGQLQFHLKAEEADGNDNDQ